MGWVSFGMIPAAAARGHAPVRAARTAYTRTKTDAPPTHTHMRTHLLVHAPRRARVVDFYAQCRRGRAAARLAGRHLCSRVLDPACAGCVRVRVGMCVGGWGEMCICTATQLHSCNTPEHTRRAAEQMSQRLPYVAKLHNPPPLLTYATLLMCSSQAIRTRQGNYIIQARSPGVRLLSRKECSLNMSRLLSNTGRCAYSARGLNTCDCCACM